MGCCFDATAPFYTMNNVHFKNGKMTVMQVSDPQDLSFINRTMQVMLDKVYNQVKPDLVVFTGDNILGNHLRDARFGSRQTVKTDAGEKKRMEKAIDNIVRPLQKRGIPFVFIYGNHDDRNCITKEEQAEIYNKYPLCRMRNTVQSGVDVDTCYLPLFSSDNKKEIFRLWLMDTAWYDKEEDKCHEAIKPEAVEWFQRECTKNTDGIPGLLFIHIPLPETNELFELCPAGVGGVLDYKHFRQTGERRYFRLNPTKAQGDLFEIPYADEENSGLFAAVKAHKSILGIVSGHDHPNCFDGMHEGVRFLQTACASLRCYGTTNRGVRIFELNENNPTQFSTRHLTYSDIMGNGLWAQLRYLLDADGLQKYKYTLLAATGTALLSATTVIAHKLKTTLR